MKFLASALLALLFVPLGSAFGQESARGHLKRGNELAASKNFHEAIAEFRAAISLDPSNPNAHWAVAKALDALGQDENFFNGYGKKQEDEALKEYQTALKLDPALKDDKTESAERHVRRAAHHKGPNFGRWYSTWCGDFSDNWVNHCMDNAITEYRIALLLDPSYVPAHLGLGLVFEKLHKHDAAIEEFRTALRLDPQSADAHLGLGHSLEKKRKLHDALQEYRAALPMEEARTKYEKLSAKLGIKKDEPQTNLGEKPDPREERLFFYVHAKGDQVYTCKGDGAQFVWALMAPDAKLFDKDGKPFGRHFAGPSWEADDGSRVTGKAVASASLDADSIPWLIVNIISHDGNGVLSPATRILRVNTKGGKAPAPGCDASHADQQVRVSYSADYLFYAPE
jgi:Tfp pilus assembly protein PilF